MRANYNKPSGAVKKAINEEVNRQIAEGVGNMSKDITATVLWQLHVQEGWGKTKLLRFAKNFGPALAELQDFYQMHSHDETDFLVKYKLKEIGVDVDKIECLIPIKAKINK
jgi:hypothetical protein